MIVNVVMLTKDRPKLTTQALNTLRKNTQPGMYNLTVIDDGGGYPPPVWDKNAVYLRIRAQDSKGITGQARNLGVYWAEKYWGRGDYLYLTDNDMYFTPGWLEKMVDMYGHSDVRVLGGWNHPFLQPRLECAQKAFGHGGCVALGYGVMTHDAVTGASQLMRWETWDKYGPLDAHAPGVGQSEDWAMCQKIIKDGGYVGSIYQRVVYNCGLVNTMGQASPGADIMLKELWEAKKQYPDLTWES